MTHATNGEPRRVTVTAADRAISKEVRAEIARQKPERGLSQAQMAFELFGENQQWFNRRLNGVTAFTAAELLAIANYLEVDVVQFLNATKKGDGPLAPNSPLRELSLTVPYAKRYLAILPGGGSTTAARKPPLHVLSSDAA